MTTLESWLDLARALPRRQCPPPQWLHQMVIGDLPAARQRQVRSHLSDCPACAAEYELAALFESDERPAGDRIALNRIVARLERVCPAGTEATSSRRSARLTARGSQSLRREPGAGWWQLAAAAALLALVTFVSWSGPPALPDRPETSIPRGTVLGAIAPRGDVEQPPARLVWQRHPEATAYQVRVTLVDGTPVWETTTPSASADVPAPVTAALKPFVRYEWTAEAVDSAGETLAITPLQSFRILPVDNSVPRTP